MAAPDPTWLADNPWRVDMARTVVADLAPAFADATISPADERRLLTEATIVAAAEDVPVRIVWLRDVNGYRNPEQAYAAEQAIRHTETAHTPLEVAA